MMIIDNLSEREREILDIRRTLEERPGFDLKDFHRRILEGG